MARPIQIAHIKTDQAVVIQDGHSMPGNNNADAVSTVNPSNHFLLVVIFCYWSCPVTIVILCLMHDTVILCLMHDTVAATIILLFLGWQFKLM